MWKGSQLVCLCLLGVLGMGSHILGWPEAIYLRMAFNLWPQSPYYWDYGYE